MTYKQRLKKEIERERQGWLAALPADSPAQPPIPTLDPNAVAAASPVYGPQIAANNTGLADTYTDLGVTFDANGAPVYGGGQYFSGAQNYGVDENGNLISQGDTRFNPFSEAQMMRVAFDQRKNATLNSYAARGQLYAGSLGNAQTSDATNYAQSFNGLQRAGEGFYSGLVSKARGARDTTTSANAGLTGQAVGDYVGAHANDPAPVPPPPPAPKPPKPKVARPRIPHRLFAPIGFKK